MLPSKGGKLSLNSSVNIPTWTEPWSNLLDGIIQVAFAEVKCYRTVWVDSAHPDLQYALHTVPALSTSYECYFL